MALQITRGKLHTPQRVVIYGPEGVGKSTLASQAPRPLFIDTEGSTSDLDVARLPRPATWGMLMSTLADVARDPEGYQTLVIDTADWAEKLAIDEVCAEMKVPALGGQKDFGQTYNTLASKWSDMLDSLTDISERHGMHIVLTAHSQIKKLEQPEEFGAYDRYQLKLEKKTSALTREWCNMLLFATYKVYVIEDEKTKSKKAQGGQRVIHTEHEPCWDAKNRKGMPSELPMSWQSLAPYLAGTDNKEEAKLARGPAMPPASAAPQRAQAPIYKSREHEQLREAMQASGITDSQLVSAIENHEKLGSIFPKGMIVDDYPEEFISRTLLPAWERVVAAAREYSA